MGRGTEQNEGTITKAIKPVVSRFRSRKYFLSQDTPSLNLADIFGSERHRKIEERYILAQCGSVQRLIFNPDNGSKTDMQGRVWVETNRPKDGSLEDKVIFIKGVVRHELCHLLRTNKKAFKRFMAQLEELGRTQGMKEALQIKHLWNILEDGMIERWAKNERPGMYRFIYLRNMLDPKVGNDWTEKKDKVVPWDRDYVPVDADGNELEIRDGNLIIPAGTKLSSWTDRPAYDLDVQAQLAIMALALPMYEVGQLHPKVQAALDEMRPYILAAVTGNTQDCAERAYDLQAILRKHDLLPPKIKVIDGGTAIGRQSDQDDDDDESLIRPPVVMVQAPENMDWLDQDDQDDGSSGGAQAQNPMPSASGSLDQDEDDQDEDGQSQSSAGGSEDQSGDQSDQGQEQQGDSAECADSDSADGASGEDESETGAAGAGAEGDPSSESESAEGGQDAAAGQGAESDESGEGQSGAGAAGDGQGDEEDGSSAGQSGSGSVGASGEDGDESEGAPGGAASSAGQDQEGQSGDQSGASSSGASAAGSEDDSASQNQNSQSGAAGAQGKDEQDAASAGAAGASGSAGDDKDDKNGSSSPEASGDDKDGADGTSGGEDEGEDEGDAADGKGKDKGEGEDEGDAADGKGKDKGDAASDSKKEEADGTSDGDGDGDESASGAANGEDGTDADDEAEAQGEAGKDGKDGADADDSAAGNTDGAGGSGAANQSTSSGSRQSKPANYSRDSAEQGGSGASGGFDPDAKIPSKDEYKQQLESARAEVRSELKSTVANQDETARRQSGSQYYNWNVPPAHAQVRMRDMAPYCDDDALEDEAGNLSKVGTDLAAQYKLMKDKVKRPTTHVRRGRLDKRALSRVAAGDPNVMLRPGVRSEEDMEVQVVIDRSGSTDGWVSHLYRMAMMFGHAGNKTKIPTAIWGYDGGNTLDREKRYDYDAERYQVGHFEYKAADRPDLKTLRAIFKTGGGGTPTGDAIEFARARFAYSKAKQKLLPIVTDGDPDDVEYCAEQVAAARREGITVICLAFNCQRADTKEKLTKAFGADGWMEIEDYSKAPGIVAGIIRKMKQSRLGV